MPVAWAWWMPSSRKLKKGRCRLATKWINSIHGRTPLWKKILIVVLVLLLLGGGAFLYCQNHLVYDENGQVHLELPFVSKKEPQTQPSGGEQDPNDIDFSREVPQGPVIETLRPRSRLQMLWSRFLLPPFLRSKRPLC